MSYYAYATAVLSGAPVTLTTNGEAVVATTAKPDEQLPPAAGVLISGFVNVTTGASGTTAVVIKVRQGTTTGGTQVGSSITLTIATAVSGVIPFAVIDATGGEPIGQYSVTATQTGGSANGTAFGTISVSPLQEA